jgi:hypothetical protein
MAPTLPKAAGNGNLNATNGASHGKQTAPAVRGPAAAPLGTLERYEGEAAKRSGLMRLAGKFGLGKQSI